VILIDTPGFDDSARTDTEILTEISQLLAFQYESGLSLKGLIYVHRITDIRYARSSVKTLNIFQKICGAKALKNVILVTTRWGEVDQAQGAERERELRSQFWKYMLGHGSTMMRYHGDQDSAVTIASQLLQKSTIVLELQRELVDEKKNLDQTSAGAYVNDNIEEMKRAHAKEMADLEQLRRDLLASDREMRKQVQQDLDIEKQRLNQYYQQQVSLQRPIGQEVHQAIGQEKKKRSSLGKFIPLLPAVIDMLGMFVGIPPGGASIFASWFGSTDLGESFTDFFSSF
jgi:hypothetical protein